MRFITILATGFTVMAVTGNAQQPPLRGPQAPHYQGVAEKQPIGHPTRGLEPENVPADLLPLRPKVLIPELTEVRLTLRDDMKSGFTRPGSEIVFQISQDVYGPGPVLVLTKGTPAVGHVVASDGYKAFGKSGYLYLTCDYILAQDKTRIPLRAVEKQANGRSYNDVAFTAGIAGAVAGAGTISSRAWDATVRWWPVGLIAGPIIAAIVPGKNVNLHPGQEFMVHTERDVAVATPLPYTASAPTEEEIRVALLTGRRRYPTVHLRGGLIWGDVKKDADGKWATVYGPLGREDRVLVEDIVSVEP